MKSNAFSHAFYTMFHPVQGFDAIKWDKKGSFPASVSILLVLFLYNVLNRQATGFIFNNNNLDEINVLAIFLITMGTFVLWYISNLAICSFMDGEGKSREIWIASSYALFPYTLISLFEVFSTNFLSAEAAPFLAIVRNAAEVWSFLLMAIAMYVIHQYTVKQTLANLALTAAGIGIITFMLVLVFSLFQQVYVFLFTIYNEIMFRL